MLKLGRDIPRAKISDEFIHGRRGSFIFVLIAGMFSAWDRNTSPISKLGDLFSFPSSPTLVEEFQFLGTSAKGVSASAKGTKPN